ncbi:hypothetical protein [Streptomyces apocyni]|uniref:hypothetical protein n=1 Tax=Streptomyces apocyni TaxID=2654677 RepID=UPI0018D0823F|nr:hypothetical protein [Streptomyces apocyni]
MTTPTPTFTTPAPSAPTLTAAPELSCYTTNLVSYLRPWIPDVDVRLAHAVRLSVRTDAPGGELAFSHHGRIDRTPDGQQLGYRGSGNWAYAKAALDRELALNGRVLACGNTRYLSWSPAFGLVDVPHWVLLERAAGGRWRLTDHFSALLPQGEQRPFAGTLDDDELRAALTPVGRQVPEYALRDTFALGEAVPVSSPMEYRWLVREPVTAAHPRRGTWVSEPLAVLSFLGERLSQDADALARNADDVWAAARHHQHRLAVLAEAGLLSPSIAAEAAASWGELPRSLRFAVVSGQRGRPRPGLVAKAFDDVLDTMSRLVTEPRAVTDSRAATESRAVTEERSR